MGNEYERALIFFNRKIIVHVVKEDGTFYNGLILEISKEFFVIQDRVMGEQYVLFAELKRQIEPYRVEEEGDGRD